MARERKTELTSLEKKDQYLRKTYNITIAQYQQMLVEQDFGCKICGRKPKKGGRPLHVDHDHKKGPQQGRVRGLLCFSCNHRLLGRGLESAYLHYAAYEYLTSDFDGRMI